MDACNCYSAWWCDWNLQHTVCAYLTELSIKGVKSAAIGCILKVNALPTKNIIFILKERNFTKPNGTIRLTIYLTSTSENNIRCSWNLFGLSLCNVGVASVCQVWHGSWFFTRSQLFIGIASQLQLNQCFLQIYKAIYIAIMHINNTSACMPCSIAYACNNYLI